MKDFSAHISQCKDCEMVLELVYSACKEKAALWISYHFTPIFESQTSRDSVIWTRDLPLEYQKMYIGEDYRHMDPVPHLTFEYGPILTWTAARNRAQGDAQAENYFAQLEARGIADWAGFALFGPRNRDGFAALQFSRDPDGFAAGHLQEVHSLLLLGHLQICKIIDDGKPSVSLSEREREVLEWMGRGKTMGEIATILSISPETVRTYARRIYEKLDTGDRVTATVRALKLGLIDL